MPIDSNIALGVKPIQLESPINQMSNVYALQNAAQSNQLNQMKMEEYKRGLAESEAFKRNMLGVDANTPEGQQSIYNNLLRTGRIDDATKFAKNIVETKNLGLTGQETQGKINKQKMEQRQATLRDTSRNPSDANLTAHVEDILLSPLYSAEEKAASSRMLTQLLAMPIPERQAFLASQGASASDLKPNIQMQNLNNKSNVLSVPAYGGAPTTLSSTPMGISPEAQQRLANENKRLANEQNPNVVAHQQVSENGTVTNFNKFGQVIGTVEGVGKPSAQFTKTKEQTKKLNTDLNLAITELDNATKDGGLIDQSTGSGLGKAANAVRGFVTGGASPGAIAGAKLAPIADLALKMVPRFEGPQSDKDTQSYKEAAGQLADTSIPNEIRKEAGRTVLRLMKARKNQFVTQDMAQEGVVPSAGGVDSSNPLLK